MASDRVCAKCCPSRTWEQPLIRRTTSDGPRVTFALDDDNHEWLRAKATAERRSMALVVNEMIAAERQREIRAAALAEMRRVSEEMGLYEEEGRK